MQLFFFFLFDFLMARDFNLLLWTKICFVTLFWFCLFTYNIALPTCIAPPTHPSADNGFKEIECQSSVLPPRVSTQQSRSLGLLCDLGSATSARMQAELWCCSSSIKAMPNPPVTADRTYSQPVVSLGSLSPCRHMQKRGSSLNLPIRAAEGSL